jgi:hypothetical protein
MEIEKIVRKGITIGAVALIGMGIGIGLSKLNSNLPPTISEQLVEEKFESDYKNAIMEYSRQVHDSKNNEILNLKVLPDEIPGEIDGKYVGFSKNQPSARYLDDGSYVSSDLIDDFVKAYNY